MEVLLKKRNVGNLRKLVSVDANNNPTGEEKTVRVEEVEGNVIQEGTPITEEVLENINWRDEFVIIKNQENNVLPEALSEMTQIVATIDGSVWVIPSQSSGQGGYKLDSNASPFITSVLDTYDTSYKTGIQVVDHEIQVLDAEAAQKNSSGVYKGNKGVVTIVAENGLNVNSGVVNVGKCEAVTSTTQQKHGTVQVIQGNGLTVTNGTIKMDVATSSKAGTLTSADYNELRGFGSGKVVTNMNNATTNALYYGTNVTNAPTTNPITCLVVKNNNIITQTLVDQSTNKIWIRTINNGSIGQWKTTKTSQVLYEGEYILNSETRLNTGVSMYSEGFRRIKLEVYVDSTDYDSDYLDYKFKNHASLEIPLFEEPTDNNESLTSDFTLLTGLTLSYKYWIKGRVTSDSVYLSAFSSLFTATGSESNYKDSSSLYHIKIIGYKE